MDIKSKNIEIYKIDEIKLNPNNRNKHPEEQIDRLSKIIKYQGFRRPVTISNRTGFLVAGEGRYLAAKKLGYTEIPVMFQDYESEEQEYADGIADNAVDKMAQLDYSSINLDLQNLGPEFDIDLLGIQNFFLEPAEKFIEKNLWTDNYEGPEKDNSCKLILTVDNEEIIYDVLKKIGVSKIDKKLSNKVYCAKYPAIENE